MKSDTCSGCSCQTKKSSLNRDCGRLAFIKFLTLGWLTLVLALLGGVSSLLRYIFPRVLFEPPQKFKAGFPSDYKVGEVSTKYTKGYNVFIVREKHGIYVLSSVCTHLGCTPSWNDSETKFKCPCHGSGFRKTGINFEGPAPRPLERYGIRLDDSGMIEIDKSQKYYFEKGQWGMSGSILLF